MTPEEILKMARQAGFERVVEINPNTGIKTVEAYADDSLERFAKLVAAKEREACAKLVEHPFFGAQGQECADAIRARGEA